MPSERAAGAEPRRHQLSVETVVPEVKRCSRSAKAHSVDLGAGGGFSHGWTRTFHPDSIFAKGLRQLPYIVHVLCDHRTAMPLLQRGLRRGTDMSCSRAFFKDWDVALPAFVASRVAQHPAWKQCFW